MSVSASVEGDSRSIVKPQSLRESHASAFQVEPGMSLRMAVAGCFVLAYASATVAQQPSVRIDLDKSPQCPAQGQDRDAAPPPPGSLASLLAEGYGIVQMRIGEGTLILRKKWSYTPTYFCNPGPIGSPTAMTCKYDHVPCSLAPDGYP
jgi:hypothetical protein